MRNFTVSTTQDGGWWVFDVHELGCVGQMKYQSEIRCTLPRCAARVRSTSGVSASCVPTGPRCCPEGGAAAELGGVNVPWR